MRDCIDNRKKINQCAILILNISQPSVKTVRRLGNRVACFKGAVHSKSKTHAGGAVQLLVLVTVQNGNIHGVLGCIFILSTTSQNLPSMIFRSACTSLQLMSPKLSNSHQNNHDV